MFATPHSKNPVKSNVLSYANVNFSYLRDNYEILSHTIKNSKTQKVIPSGSFFNQYARLAYDLAKVWRRINMKLLFGTGNQA